MSEREVTIGVGKTKELPGGLVARTDYVEKGMWKRASVIPSFVDRAESGHAVLGENLGTPVKKLVTNSDGSGFVEFSGNVPPEVAAVHIGTGSGHDEEVIRRSGMPLSTAISLANGMKRIQHDEIDEVARESALMGSLNRSQIRNAMEDGKRGRRVKIVIFDKEKNQKVEESESRVKSGGVLKMGVDFDIPKAA